MLRLKLSVRQIFEVLKFLAVADPQFGKTKVFKPIDLDPQSKFEKSYI